MAGFFCNFAILFSRSFYKPAVIILVKVSKLDSFVSSQHHRVLEVNELGST